MGQVERDFEAHPLWGLIEAVNGQLNTAPEVTEPDANEHLARLRWLHEQLVTVRQRQPWSVPVVILNSIQNALGTLSQTLATWAANPVDWPSYLTPAATQQADAVLVQMGVLQPLPSADVQAADAAAHDAISRTTASMTNLHARVAELEAQIANQQAASTAAVQQQVQATETAVATLTQQQAALEQQVAVLGTTITEQSTALATALTTHQSAFDAKQSERTAVFDETVAAIKQNAATLAEDLGKKADAARQTQTDAAKAHIARLGELQEQAEAVVQATGRRAITTEYGQYAEGQRGSAFWWSVVTVVLALCGFVFVAYELHDLGRTPPSWQVTFLKLAGSVALLGVAGYTGKQAAEHRHEERDAKRTQLDINAVEPFLSRLPEGKQDELRADIADRVFARRAVEATKTDGPSIPVDLSTAGLIGKAIQAFTEK